MEAGKVTGANVSVKIDDEFMKAVVNDTNHTYSNILSNSQTLFMTKEIDARQLWEKIIHNAWKSAEPEFFSGIPLSANQFPIVMQNLVTKPFQPIHAAKFLLCPYDSCRLIAINLYSYVENPFTSRGKIQFRIV